MKTLLLVLLLFFVSGLEALNAQKLEKVWETTVALKTPESVLFDEENDIMYVANINGDPTTKDGNGFISILNADGSEKNLEWVVDLDAPKGMALSNGKLYVSDIDRLVEIDVQTGKIISRYHAANAVFLNDVAACNNGMILVSDTRTAKIYALVNGSLSVWFEGEPLETPNGLFTEMGKLFVGDQNIYEVDIKTKEIKQIIADAGGVDGLEKNNEGEFVFSNWPGRVFVHRNGKNIKLLDTTAEEINTADLDFALKPDLVLVPTFFDNKVVAYKIVD
jgi:DNA-binding beta-propeller fold protein YncE